MNVVRMALLTACLVFTQASHAQGLLDIYQLAKLADPVWLGSLASNKAAQETTEQSRANFLPNVSLSADSTHNFQDRRSSSLFAGDNRETFNSNSWSLSITQPVFRLSNYAAHRQARATVQQSNIQLEADAQDLIIRVAQAYFTALSAEAELDSVQAEKKAIARQLDQATKRFDVGLIAITDVHEAQASYDLSVASEIEAQNNLSLARIALSEITGQHHQQLADTRNDMPLVSPEPENISEWINVALENNRSLTAAKASVTIAQENVKIQRSGHYPTLDLVATSGNNTSHGGTLGSDTDSSTIGLQLSVPIYEGGAVNSRTRQALAELEQARQGLTQTKRATERLTRDAYLGVIADISRIKALKQAVISAQSAVDATEAGFEVGTRTIVDVLNVQRDLFRSQTNFQQARYTYILNGLRLKQAAGSLSDEDISRVNEYLAQP